MHRLGLPFTAIGSRARRSGGDPETARPRHRPLWQRCATAVQAVWLALALMDAGALRPYCPMHDGLAPTSATHLAAMGHMTVASAAHSADHSHVAAAGHSGASQPQAGHVGGCPCLGDCASVAPVAVATTASHEWALAAAPSLSAASSAERLSPRHLASDHFLPFPHAPPLV